MIGFSSNNENIWGYNRLNGFSLLNSAFKHLNDLSYSLMSVMLTATEYDDQVITVTSDHLWLYRFSVDILAKYLKDSLPWYSADFQIRLAGSDNLFTELKFTDNSSLTNIQLYSYEDLQDRLELFDEDTTKIVMYPVTANTYKTLISADLSISLKQRVDLSSVSTDYDTYPYGFILWVTDCNGKAKFIDCSSLFVTPNILDIGITHYNMLRKVVPKYDSTYDVSSKYNPTKTSILNTITPEDLFIYHTVDHALSSNVGDEFYAWYNKFLASDIVKMYQSNLYYELKSKLKDFLSSQLPASAAIFEDELHQYKYLQGYHEYVSLGYFLHNLNQYNKPTDFQLIGIYGSEYLRYCERLNKGIVDSTFNVYDPIYNTVYDNKPVQVFLMFTAENGSLVGMVNLSDVATSKDEWDKQVIASIYGEMSKLEHRPGKELVDLIMPTYGEMNMFGVNYIQL